MKKILVCLLSLSALSAFGMELVPAHSELSPRKEHHHHLIKLNLKEKMKIEPSSVFIPEKLGKMEVFHNRQGFYVHKDDQKIKIKKYFTDPMVRDLNKDQLKAFLKGGYLTINEMEDGTLSLKSKIRLQGSGLLGASIGAFLGKAAVYVVGHGAIQVVGVLTGPFYPVTVLALEGCFAVPIEAASMAGAVAGGIALGVATGPV